MHRIVKAANKLEGALESVGQACCHREQVAAGNPREALAAAAQSGEEMVASATREIGEYSAALAMLRNSSLGHVDRIVKTADRLLSALAVQDSSFDGGGSPLGQQVFETLAYVKPLRAEVVTSSNQRISRVLAAINELRIRASAAAEHISASELKTYMDGRKVASRGKWSVPDGNQQDAALNEWIRCSLRLYKAITGECPRTSVRAADGVATGPLLRFLIAAGRPLHAEFGDAALLSEDALRSRVRRILEAVPK